LRENCCCDPFIGAQQPVVEHVDPTGQHIEPATQRATIDERLYRKTERRENRSDRCKRGDDKRFQNIVPAHDKGPFGSTAPLPHGAAQTRVAEAVAAII
jgi:hypothetical protein